MAELLPSNDPSSVRDDELSNLIAANEEALAARVQDDSHTLRAAAIEKLTSHNALHEGRGWCTFAVGQENDDERASVATIGDYKDILLLMYTEPDSPSIEGHPIPTTRIIVNEPYLNNGVVRWLTLDFTLDGENDAQYGYGVFDPTSDSDDPQTIGVKFFITEEGLLALANFQIFTLVDQICYEFGDGESGKCQPFGHYSSLNDKLHALTIGRKILEEINSVDPYFGSVD